MNEKRGERLRESKSRRLEHADGSSSVASTLTIRGSCMRRVLEREEGSKQGWNDLVPFSSQCHFHAPDLIAPKNVFDLQDLIG